MRKLVPFLLCLSVVVNAQNFTPGNIVAVRMGDGSATISTGIAAPVFLDEYTQSGTLVRSIAMPTAVSGANKMLTCNGASTAEGSLTTSADGQYLTLCGYNAAVGTTGGTSVGSTKSGISVDNSTPGFVNRVIGIIDYQGNVNTTTALADAFSEVNFRGAVTDNGNNIWMCGDTYSPTIATSGIRYATIGSSSSTKISSNIDNAKTVGIANNQLFVTSGSGSNRTISTLGTGLPTGTGQIAAALPGLPDGTQLSPNGFVFFDMDASVSGPDLLYIADDGTSTSTSQGLNKYSFDGTTWTKQGRLAEDCSGLTGYINCNGNIVLFITSGTGYGNKIYKFTDLAAYNSPITSNGSALSAVGTPLRTAGNKQVFRGIQMAPGPGLSITGSAASLAGNYNKITIKNGANATLAGNITVADKMVVEAGAILDCGNFTISSASGTAGYFEVQSGATLKIGSTDGITAAAASGNIQTCQRRFNSGGLYEYYGTAAQNTGDGLPSTISGKLTLNNASGITLSASTKVSGTINFTAGRLQTSANSFITVTSSTQYSRYPTSYVQTAEETSFIDGPAKFESNANTYQLIPVGKNGHFAPVGITPFNSTLKTYTAEYFAGTPTDYSNIIGGLDHISKLEYWDIGCTATTNPEMDAKISLYWSPNSTVGHNGDDANALPDLRIAHYENTGSGTKWQLDAAGASGFSTTGTIDYGKISAKDYATHFSPFTLASSSYRNLLPVILVKWLAEENDHQVQLKWQTTDENDLACFIVQRSADGQNFTDIQTLPAKNKPGLNDYEITDRNPFLGLTFYRLVIIGKNGEKTYTTIEKIKMAKEAGISVYPNPAKGFCYVNLPAATGVLKLADPTGKTLQAITVDNKLMRLNVQNLAMGTYYIMYDGEGGKTKLELMIF